jgi:hypothetical protein
VRNGAACSDDRSPLPRAASWLIALTRGTSRLWRDTLSRQAFRGIITEAQANPTAPKTGPVYASRSPADNRPF